MKRRMFIGLALVLVLAACGRQENSSSTPAAPNEPAQAGPPEVQGRPSISSPPQSFLDAIEVFADRYPTFGGYGFPPDRSRLVIYTTDNRSDNARKMRDDFVDLVESTTGFPR